MHCDSDLPEKKRKHSAKDAKELLAAEITAIILANSTQGDDEVWRVNVSDVDMAGIATAIIGQPINDDKIGRLRLAGHICGRPSGWPCAGPGRTAGPPGVQDQNYIEDFYAKHQTSAEIARNHNVANSVVRKTVQNYDPMLYQNEMLMRSEEKRIYQESKRRPKKVKRIIQEQPGLRKELDFQFETQKEMGEWLDWEGPNACATKKKKTSASDADMRDASISQFSIDAASGKRVRIKKNEHLCVLPRGIPRHIPYCLPGCGA
jgi:predicted DNA-binding protein YlxM (UPF0122 family)